MSLETTAALISAIATALSAIFSAAAAVLSLIQIRRTTNQLEIQKSQLDTQQQSDRARVFLEITDRWSDIYPTRNHVLAAPIMTKADIEKEFKADYRRFLESAQWKDLRAICNFFEFLGVTLHHNYIDADHLFVLVTVDVFKEIVDSVPRDVPEGVMYSRLKGPIEYLRSVYRTDIYVFYDQYLLPMYKKHKPLIPVVT